MTKYVIGVDGGGTKTELVLVDNEGNLISKERVGSTNFQAMGGPNVRQELLDGFEKIINNSKIQLSKIDHIYLGLAGAGRVSDQKSIADLFDDTEYQGKITVNSDAIIALAGAFGTEPGIIIISGTGAICFGSNERGEVVRSGGWGYLLGDEGSGYYIGREAVVSAFKDFDGRGEKTILKKKIIEHFKLQAIDELVPLIYQNKIDRIKIANLAPLVFDCAKKGDAISEGIIKKSGQELGKLAKAVAEKLGFSGEEVNVALIGSIFKQKDLLLNHISKELYEISWNVSIIDPMFQPSYGAALMALKFLNYEINESLLTTLKNSIKNFIEIQ
ncbi:hypothetical protein B6I21_00715 [candidate division KSB1 bacterium 4572_119]|nr:MAG: hypothetical protein B6I21_00715 [candidate division KSB1 bacterium 4572_119]